MSDAISRQAAINSLTEYGNGRAVFISVGEAVIRIEQLPPIQPEPHWIPVEQESPKIGEYVLCQTTPHFFKTMHCFNNYHVCQFVDKDKWIDKPHFDWDRDGFPHVIAWTRFEPYKGVTT